MKTLLVFLSFLLSLNNAIAKESNNNNNEINLPASPPQKVLSSYQTNFSYQHDKGLYLSAMLGPTYNASFQKPTFKAIRFSGKFALGWFVANGIAIHADIWGHFLEKASMLAFGPGAAILFNGPNVGIDFSLGIGRVFNAISYESFDDFSETVLAANFSLSKYWWLSTNTSIGVSLVSGIHGLTLFSQRINTVGINAGIGLTFLFG